MSKKTKIWLIVGVSLVLVGCIIFGGVMTVLKWDFSKLSTNSFETNRYEISDTFKDISVSAVTTDINFVPTEDSKVSVVCYENKKIKYSVAVKNNSLVIEEVDYRKWYEYLGINVGKRKITVYLPKGEYGNITVKNTTGDIELPQGFTFASAEFSVTTGDVAFKASVTGDVNLKSTTGDIELTDVRCNALTANGTTGDIKMNNVIADGKITLKRTTGDVEFKACDAAELFIKVTTGHIEGTLLSSKKFEASAATGRVEVPQSEQGGLCKVTTTTGKIKISIE